MKYPDRNAPRVEDNPFPHRCCAIDDNADRCRRPGTMTESIKGSDRWYCYRHFAPFKGLNHPAEDPPPPPYVNASDYFEKRKDGKDWARGVLALAERSEYRSTYGVELAREVMGRQ